MMQDDPQISQTARSDMRGFDDYSISLGDEMRGRRATLGKSLLDVEQELKIRALLVDAIEKADPMAFDADWLISGHVKSYARYLGMNPDETYDRFCKEGGYNPQQSVVKSKDTHREPRRGIGRLFRWRNKTAYPSPLGQLEDMRDSRLAFDALGSTLVLLALTGGIVYVGWAVYDEVQRVAATRSDQIQTVSAPDISSNLVGPLGGTDAAVAPVSESAQIPSLGPDSIGTMDPNRTGFFTTPADSDEVNGGEDSILATELPDKIGGNESVAIANANQVVIVPSRPAWIRVTSFSGTTIYEKVLDGGEQYLVPDLENAPKLRAGNAGSLYFLIGGEVFGPAGTSRNVIKEVDLSADSLRQNYSRLLAEAVPLEIQNSTRLSEAVSR